MCDVEKMRSVFKLGGVVKKVLGGVNNDREVRFGMLTRNGIGE